MKRTWSRPINSPLDGPEYWDYFGVKLVELATIPQEAKVLDVGCGTGPSLFTAVEKTGPRGYAVGIDLCQG
jgi:ubiquinone/menaquinone biosynthesis C-methylase UbiE